MPPPPEPWALVAKGSHNILRIPERLVPKYVANEWLLIARDSQVPLVLDEGQYFDETLPFHYVMRKSEPPPDDTDGA